MLAAGLWGCAGGVSPQARAQVTFGGGFAELQARPEAYDGAVALLGGRIIDSEPGSASSALTVLQLPLDGRDRPLDGDRSEGRFRVAAPRFLDPEIYRKGALITLVGRVAGSETRPIGTFDYRMPRFEALEIVLWPPESAIDPGPRLHFGFGIGTRL
jgi:outer membrane lipoprotein